MNNEQLRRIGTGNNRLTPETLEMLRKLAGGIAHDYNNILTIILGNLTLARSYQGLDSEILEIISDMEKATHKAKEITETLIQFSKNRELNYKQGCLREFIYRLSTKIFPPGSTNVKINSETDLEPMPFDHFNLEAALTHIFKFIKTENCHCNNLEIKIYDSKINGIIWRDIVITAADLILPEDRIATLFFPRFSAKKEDYGIGLVAASSLIHEHQGEFNVSCKGGEGTTFIIHLPAVLDKEKQVTL